MFLIKIMPTLAGTIHLIMSLVDTYYYGILALFSESTRSKFLIIIKILITTVVTVLALICTTFLITSLKRYRLLAGQRLSHKEANIMLLGDAKSKEYLLRRMLNDWGETVPVPAEFRTERIKFKIFNLGGHQNALRVWRDYYLPKVDAVVYVADGFSPGRSEEPTEELRALLDDESLLWRFKESTRELNALLADELLLNVPFLILGYNVLRLARNINSMLPGNNIDSFCHFEMLSDIDDRAKLSNTNVHPVGHFRCSEYDEGIRWLSRYIN